MLRCMKGGYKNDASSSSLKVFPWFATICNVFGPQHQDMCNEHVVVTCFRSDQMGALGLFAFLEVLHSLCWLEGVVTFTLPSLGWSTGFHFFKLLLLIPSFSLLEKHARRSTASGKFSLGIPAANNSAAGEWPTKVIMAHIISQSHCLTMSHQYHQQPISTTIPDLQFFITSFIGNVPTLDIIIRTSELLWLFFSKLCLLFLRFLLFHGINPRFIHLHLREVARLVAAVIITSHDHMCVGVQFMEMADEWSMTGQWWVNDRLIDDR